MLQIKILISPLSKFLQRLFYITLNFCHTTVKATMRVCDARLLQTYQPVTTTIHTLMFVMILQNLYFFRWTLWQVPFAELSRVITHHGGRYTSNITRTQNLGVSRWRNPKLATIGPESCLEGVLRGLGYPETCLGRVPRPRHDWGPRWSESIIGWQNCWTCVMCDTDTDICV